MAITRPWRASHAVEGPFRARIEEIGELNQVFSDAFTERYRRDGYLGRSTRNAVLLARYLAGADPERLARVYG